MNYLEMATYLAGSVLRRGTGSETLLLAKNAIKEAHLFTQRLFDWPCMKAHSFGVFRADGILLPLDVRGLREVYTVNGTTNVKETFLLPASLDVNQQVAIAPTLASVPTTTARWWVEEGRLFITPSLATGTKVRLDYYRLLPVYVNDTDEDWFARWAWDALVYRAAQLGSVSLWQDDRTTLFSSMADERLGQAKKLASEADSGGMAHHVRPPVRSVTIG